MRLRFSKSSRLSGWSAFRAVRTKGKSLRGRWLTLGAYRLDQTASAPQIGIVTHSGNGPAVVRSRMRRVLREAIRRELPQIAPGWWLVLVARRGLDRAQFTDIQRELRDLLGKAGVLSTQETP